MTKKKNNRKKITVTIDKNINDILDKYIEDNDLYNKSHTIETFIKKQIEKDKEIK
ncbi:MAG: hypothetical protein ACLFPJ_06090 [Candidatus Woesearchaeota archaeon]